MLFVCLHFCFLHSARLSVLVSTLPFTHIPALVCLLSPNCSLFSGLSSGNKKQPQSMWTVAADVHARESRKCSLYKGFFRGHFAPSFVIFYIFIFLTQRILLSISKRVQTPFGAFTPDKQDSVDCADIIRSIMLSLSALYPLDFNFCPLIYAMQILYYYFSSYCCPSREVSQNRR